MHIDRHNRAHAAIHSMMDFAAECAEAVKHDSDIDMAEKLEALGDCAEMLADCMSAHADMCEVYDYHKKHQLDMMKPMVSPDAKSNPGNPY